MMNAFGIRLTQHQHRSFFDIRIHETFKWLQIFYIQLFFFFFEMFPLSFVDAKLEKLTNFESISSVRKTDTQREEESVCPCVITIYSKDALRTEIAEVNM